MAPTHTSLQKKILAEAAKKVGRSIVHLAEMLAEDAYTQSASDIHIDPSTTGLRVRLRIDGRLEERCVLPLNCHAELIARFKILAALRTDEHFTAQDGRYIYHAPHGEISIRVSILPTHLGENAVLRLLSSDSRIRTFAELGMKASHQQQIREALLASHGLILVTGPTGSGKTTTLYVLMRMLSDKPLSLVSIEDPVEYSIPQVSQVQVHNAAGLTFSGGLRALLRQDPDVLMVGEIRDADTAKLGTTAALTGHLVLSTLHTNDTKTVILRLQEMGVKPHLICSTLRLVIAQRLVRKTCKECVVSYPAHSSEQEYFRTHLPETAHIPATLFKGAGCNSCRGSGYRGRVGIFELQTHAKGAWSANASLLRDGLEKVVAGLTTLEEIRSIQHA